MINSNDTIGNRTRDLPVCSAVLQPTAGRGLIIQRKVLEGRMENLNNCMGHSPSSEADIPPFTQQILRILHYSKAHYHIHHSQLPVSVLSQTNPVHATVYFSKMCFDVEYIYCFV